ncbi:MAG: carbamoyltransferase HypF, partial [Deltaproteobacteria bacterium]
MNERARASINGIVQGVGFRPFIYRLAHRYRLSGYVANTSEGVVLEVEGPEKRIRCFFEALEPEHPPLARISSVERTSIPLKNDREFVIRSSRGNAERSALISPDVGVCPDCLAEMKDPGDRRFRYPFINCTNCGPRYTIIEDIPYDRASTTMRKFRMCRACRAEYLDPGNRRFHAQPNACPECGPEVTLTDASGRRLDVPDPVRAAVSLLEKGRILAVKGLGGFHLGVDAANHRAVVRLRRRKHREEKPLAVMVRDLETAHDIVHINDTEARELTSFRRPIVILRKRRFHGLSSQVAPKNRFFGVML